MEREGHTLAFLKALEEQGPSRSHVGSALISEKEHYHAITQNRLISNTDGELEERRNINYINLSKRKK